MSKKERLIEKLYIDPGKFTFQEAAKLLGTCGYEQIKGGKSDGSSAAFANSNNDYIRISKPPLRNILKTYQADEFTNYLSGRGLLE